MNRVSLLIISTLILSACAMTNWRSRDLSILEVGGSADFILFDSNKAVDNTAKEIIALFIENNFKLNSENTSFGLVPARGHTQNLSFYLQNNRDLNALVEISKSKLIVTFFELRLPPNDFTTDASGKDAVKNVSNEFKEYIKPKINFQTIKVSYFEHYQKP